MAGELGETCPEVWESVSDFVPVGVETVAAAVKLTVPPPALEMVNLWLWAGVDLAKEKEKDRGSSGASVGG
jgi:hypothetical protein